ncbi:glycosyltransferase family 2 protein [Desulfovibrio sp. OttesenSCG-928-M14]|nr:glycosyltransferase family 2 protein [Desulfovibrio sp. OttesenSCG-928-M14]
MTAKKAQHSPAIVVAAYNRPHSLRRLVGALAKASYPGPLVPLIISIDNSGSDAVLREAKAFVWPYGPKRILVRPERMGLKNHILACGDLSEAYRSIILFEDDIYPSPHFYTFACAALSRYAQDARIAGLSLYATKINETAFMGFTPLHDGSDAFFLRIPSSWGQAWTAEQWREFRIWLHARPGLDVNALVPPNVRLWPDTSWKKLFCAYMNDAAKFFVYPYLSLSTNFSDIGENHHTRSTRFQIPLQFFPKEYALPLLDESFCVYDEYCELLPDRLLKLTGHLEHSANDLSVDLYGMRDIATLPKTGLILTSRPTDACLASWARSLKPHEMNIVADIPGADLKLCRVAECEPSPRKLDVNAVCYHYNVARRVLVWCKEELNATGHGYQR